MNWKKYFVSDPVKSLKNKVASQILSLAKRSKKMNQDILVMNKKNNLTILLYFVYFGKQIVTSIGSC